MPTPPHPPPPPPPHPHDIARSLDLWLHCARQVIRRTTALRLLHLPFFFPGDPNPALGRVGPFHRSRLNPFSRISFVRSARMWASGGDAAVEFLANLSYQCAVSRPVRPFWAFRPLARFGRFAILPPSDVSGNEAT